MIALREQMAIHLAHPFMAEGPRIELFVLDSATADVQLVVMSRILGTFRFKNPRVMRIVHR